MTHIHQLYNEWLSLQPLKPEDKNRLDRKFMLEFNYNSNHIYNPQNEMFRLLGTKRSFSQNETFFFSHPYPALFRLISHF